MSAGPRAAGYAGASVRLPGVMVRSLVVSALLATSAVAREPDCRAIRDVTAKWSEVHAVGVAAQDVRQRLLIGALREALRMGSEMEVRQLNSVSTTVSEERIDEKLSEIVFERLRGFVLSHKVLSEDDTALGDGVKKFTVSIEARVCVPYASDLPEILAFGRVTGPHGTEDTGLMPLLKGAMPPSHRVQISEKSAGLGYEDIVVSGSVVDVRRRVRDRTAEVKAVSRYLGPGAVSGVAAIAHEVVVVISLEARFAGRGLKIVETVELEKALDDQRLEKDVTRAAVREAIQKAAAQLSLKISNFVETERN